MTQPIDRTKAPDPLPEVLPAGTTDRYKNRDLSGWRFLPAKGAPRGHLEDGYYPPGKSYESGICTWAISWPSYYAALSQPQPAEWVPRVGELCGGESLYDGHVVGRFEEFTEGSAGKFARLDTGHYVKRSTLRPANASGTAGSSSLQSDARGVASPEAKPAVPVRPACVACNVPIANGERCVYCERRRDLHMEGREQVLPGTQSNIDTRIAQAKKQLDSGCARRHPYADSSVVWSSAQWEDG